MSVADVNEASEDDLRRDLLACCDAPAWADEVLNGRPYDDTESLYAVADAAARRLTAADVDRALAAHPRIGERAPSSASGAGWSREEQSGVGRDDEVRVALDEGNRAYEERFGRVFLICATGLSGEAILAELQRRLGNDPGTERDVVAEELRKIALLRLRKVVES
jgi:2-oxo-4-hydroxy-4-carboxy-5-ureidoimidazoline decarboxylase